MSYDDIMDECQKIWDSLSDYERDCIDAKDLYYEVRDIHTQDRADELAQSYASDEYIQDLIASTKDKW